MDEIIFKKVYKVKHHVERYGAFFCVDKNKFDIFAIYYLIKVQNFFNLDEIYEKLFNYSYYCFTNYFFINGFCSMG